MSPKSIQNGAKKVSKSLLEAILQKNMKNSILAAIYYTLGMSAHPQNHQNWTLLGKKIVTKCIMKSSLQKSHQKVANVLKSDLKMEVLFGACQSAKPSPEASSSLPGFRNDSGALQGAKLLPRGLQDEHKSHKKLTRESVKITLGSHLAFQPALLTQGRRVPRSG